MFEVANRGDAPLILQPQPCCGFVVTGAETPIPPGATRRLVANASHPLGEGLFRKTMRVLTNDPGIGVARHADAGYEDAIGTAHAKGVRLPMEDST